MAQHNRVGPLVEDTRPAKEAWVARSTGKIPGVAKRVLSPIESEKGAPTAQERQTIVNRGAPAVAELIARREKEAEREVAALTALPGRAGASEEKRLAFLREIFGVEEDVARRIIDAWMNGFSGQVRARVIGNFESYRIAEVGERLLVVRMKLGAKESPVKEVSLAVDLGSLEVFHFCSKKASSKESATGTMFEKGRDIQKWAAESVPNGVAKVLIENERAYAVQVGRKVALSDPEVRSLYLKSNGGEMLLWRVAKRLCDTLLALHAQDIFHLRLNQNNVLGDGTDYHLTHFDHATWGEANEEVGGLTDVSALGELLLTLYHGEVSAVGIRSIRREDPFDNCRRERDFRRIAGIEEGARVFAKGNSLLYCSGSV